MWWEKKYSVKSIFPLLGPQGQGTTKNRSKFGATSINFLWLCGGYDERNPCVNYVVHFPGINLPPPPQMAHYPMIPCGGIASAKDVRVEGNGSTLRKWKHITV